MNTTYIFKACHLVLNIECRGSSGEDSVSVPYCILNTLLFIGEGVDPLTSWVCTHLPAGSLT